MLLEHVYRMAKWDRQIAFFADGDEHVYP